MEPVVKLGYIYSSTIVLTRVCRQKCGYCGFQDRSDGLLSLRDLSDRLAKIRAEKTIEVVLVSGEQPQEFPHIQMALKREDCSSFDEYLEKACELVLQYDLLPVLAIGNLTPLTAKIVSQTACTVRIDLFCDDLGKSGQAHEFAKGRTIQAGRDSIAYAHAAGLPYSLGILIGIGETRENRRKFINEIGRYCASDPYLQDVRLIPFQPVSGTPMRSRPPLPFEEVAEAVKDAKEVFPVHQISLPVNLFSRFKDCISFGLNDVGSIPDSENDPVMKSFPYPKIEKLATSLWQEKIVFEERLPLTTPAGFKRLKISRAIDACRYRMQNRGRSSLDLIDNGHCFVCGKANHDGLKLEFQMLAPYTCSGVWTPTPKYQGYAGILHGGIISTLLDEIMAQALIRSGLKVVTADMTVRFLKPTPIGVKLTFIGTRVGGRRNLHYTKGNVQSSDGVIFAEAEGRYMEC